MILRESLQVLEFEKILKNISNFAYSSGTQKAVLGIVPLSSREELERRFGLIGEIRRLAQAGMLLRLCRFEDLSEIITQVRIEGAVLEPREVFSFVPVFRIISEISLQLEDTPDVPYLKGLAGGLTGFPDLLVLIERSIDSEGIILDSASTALSGLRKQMRALEARIRKKLQSITGERKTGVFLQDDYVTRRAGRWVIPVRMDSKGQIPGVVHDVSRSGETAFVEPLEIIGMANDLENIVAEAKAEEIRILRNICRMIREAADEIEVQYKIVIFLDLLNSIARFADVLEMNIPQLSDMFEIRLVGARHPLLLLSQRELGMKEVVPLDLYLGGENRAMVITGPNAGGKTVAIKTAGLLLLMALSGIPVPADSSSTFPCLRDLLVDIGDEQSIETSLSTFSAHVFNLSRILKRADSETLVLMDEMGTGTDPVEGAAIACAVLRDLKEKGSLVLATTHLTEIVGFVYRTERMVNASMEFDHNTLTPLHRLRIGEPGQSHALEIARTYGLPVSVLDFAKEMLGNMKMEVHGLVAELKEKRGVYEKAMNVLLEQSSDLKEKERALKEDLAAVEAEKKKILQIAYNEAREIVSETKRQVYGILEETKRKKRRDAMTRLVGAQQRIEEKLREFYPEPSLSMNEIREGDAVFVRSIGYDATVVRVERRHQRLRVKSGIMELEVPISDVGAKRGKSPPPKIVPGKMKVTEEKISPVLNMVGLRVDEALSRLEPFLNHACSAGLGEITIIHGIGTGALLKAVRTYLNGHPLVEDFRSGEASRGGDGVTIVKLQ